MRILRLVLLTLGLGYIISYGLVVISSGYRIFSIDRFAGLALILTPVVSTMVLAIILITPLPAGWEKSTRLRREFLWTAAIALLASLALTPPYEGMARTLLTIVIVAAALLGWGTLSALPVLGSLEGQPTVLDWVRNGKTRRRRQILEMVLIGFFLMVGIIGTGIFLYMSGFSRMYGDDWCYHTRALKMGVFGAAIDFYLTWSGRFFSNFLLFAGAGNRWMPMGQMLLAIGSLFTCTYFLGRPIALRHSHGRVVRSGWSLACALLIPFLIYAIAPDPYKSLYWIVSSVVVLPFTILMPVFLIFINRVWDHTSEPARRKPDLSNWQVAVYSMLGFVLSFLLSTIHEVATVPLLILSAFCLLAAFRSADRRKERLIILGAAMAGSLAGLLATFLAPGNAARHAAQGYPQPPDMINLLRVNSLYFWKFLGKITQQERWFALIPAFVLGSLAARPGQSRWNPAIVIGVALLMAWASFLPGAYAAQDKIPMRAELIPVTILIFGAFSAGYFSPRYPNYFFTPAVLAIVLLVSVFFFHSLISKKLTLISPIVRFAEAWDGRDFQLRTTDDPVFLIQPPWDYKEQAEDCVNIYYNYIRQKKQEN